MMHLKEVSLRNGSVRTRCIGWCLPPTPLLQEVLVHSGSED